jgi:hypothetical protein
MEKNKIVITKQKIIEIADILREIYQEEDKYTLDEIEKKILNINKDMYKKMLVPWGTGTDKEITRMLKLYYNDFLTLEDIQTVWHIGDKRSISLNAMPATYVNESHIAQTVELQILDFDHDELTTPINNKLKALISLDQKDCLRGANISDTEGSKNPEMGYVNSTNDNSIGWTNSPRRKWCNEIYYNALPDYIKNSIKEVNKIVCQGGAPGIGVLETNPEKCFLLSPVELFGTGANTYYNNGEGNQYVLYQTAGNRIKLPKWNSNYLSGTYWERSPCATKNQNYHRANVSAANGDTSAATSLGIAPAMCL